MTFSSEDTGWMQAALEYAHIAARQDEVPVGAVLVKDQVLLAAAGNSPISSNDPTAHAEINVIRQSAAHLANYRLGGTLYVTLEPCLMCMGAIIHSRIERLVYGARDPKTGAAVSQYQVGGDGRLNHTLLVEGGLLEDECSLILREFFRERRR
jgi:tRNA(adenine34) deaminase